MVILEGWVFLVSEVPLCTSPPQDEEAGGNALGQAADGGRGVQIVNVSARIMPSCFTTKARVISSYFPIKAQVRPSCFTINPCTWPL